MRLGKIELLRRVLVSVELRPRALRQRKEELRLHARDRGLGARDQGRLSDYLNHVREVERRIQMSEKAGANALLEVDAPFGIPESFEEHARLMFELAALAYQADITLVTSYMMAKDASMISYTNLGISEPHHSTTHHLELPESIPNLVKINTYHMTLFSEFIEKLSSTPDGDGSLLDHSLILFGSGMSEASSVTPMRKSK